MSDQMALLCEQSAGSFVLKPVGSFVDSYNDRPAGSFVLKPVGSFVDSYTDVPAGSFVPPYNKNSLFLCSRLFCLEIGSLHTTGDDTDTFECFGHILWT